MCACGPAWLAQRLPLLCAVYTALQQSQQLNALGKNKPSMSQRLNALDKKKPSMCAEMR